MFASEAGGAGGASPSCTTASWSVCCFPLVRTNPSTWSTGVHIQPEVAAHHLDLAGQRDRQHRPAAFEMSEEAVAVAGRRDRVPERIDHARLLVFEQDRLDVELWRECAASFSPSTREVRYGSPSGISQPVASSITTAQVAASA